MAMEDQAAGYQEPPEELARAWRLAHPADALLTLMETRAHLRAATTVVAFSLWVQRSASRVSGEKKHDTFFSDFSVCQEPNIENAEETPRAFLRLTKNDCDTPCVNEWSKQKL